MEVEGLAILFQLITNKQIKMYTFNLLHTILIIWELPIVLLRFLKL